MNLSRFRDLCLGFPGVTEQLQWGDDAVFKVGGKMFSVAATSQNARHVCSFKCDAETFGELCERNGLTPAPYLARAHWVAAEGWDALSNAEFAALIAKAYDMVKGKLPRAAQAALVASPPVRRAIRAARSPRRAKR